MCQTPSKAIITIWPGARSTGWKGSNGPCPVRVDRIGRGGRRDLAGIADLLQKRRHRFSVRARRPGECHSDVQLDLAQELAASRPRQTTRRLGEAVQEFLDLGLGVVAHDRLPSMK
jgi:hypothetical protein